MAVPYLFAPQPGPIPLAELDADFAYVLGSVGSPQTAAELAAGVTPTYTQYKPGDVRRYGAIGDGVTNNTAAFAQAIAQATSNQQGAAAVYIPGGVFVTQLNIGGVSTQWRMYGEDPLVSILVATSTSADVIGFLAGASVWGVTFENFAIQGAAGYIGGSGIHIPANLNFPPFLMTFRNLAITGFGRSAIWDQMGMFNSTIDNCLGSATINHVFDLQGGNSLQFKGCYASVATQTTLTFTVAPTGVSGTLTANWGFATTSYPVRFSDNEFRQVTLTQGAATATWTTALTGTPSVTAVIANGGYRVHTSRPKFLSCNGLNAGQYYGIFSDNPIEDGTTNYCFPTFDGSNVESFTLTGLRNKQCGVAINNTSIVSHLAGNKGIEITPLNLSLMGPLDNDGCLVNTAGAWAGPGPGYAVHTTLNTGAPFSTVFSPEGNNQYLYYDDAAAVATALSCEYQTLIRTARYAQGVFDHYVLGMSRLAYSGHLVFSGTTTANVVFTTASTDNTYVVALVQSATSVSPPWVTAKLTTGFTINFTAAFTGTVDWTVTSFQ